MNKFKKIVILTISLLLSLLTLSSCMDLFSGFISTPEPEDEKPVAKSEYTVTLDTQGGTPLAPMIVKAGEKCYTPYATMRPGAVFTGWYYKGILWNFSKNTVNEDITLVAGWDIIDYKITYDLRGGSYNGSMPEIYNVESDTITFGTPVREDYVFLGWEINGKKTNEIKKGTTDDLKVVATWFGLEAEIMFAKGGANGIVTFIHDDARLDTMAIFDSLIEKYDMVGDVGFVLNKVYNNNTVNYTALANYREYINNGRWKIVNHSATHNWWGADVSDSFGNRAYDDEALMNYELVTSQAKMRELFPGQKVLTFAYPGFSAAANKYTDGSTTQLKQVIYSPTARRLIETHHIAARMYGGGATTLGSEDIDWNWMNAQFISDSFIENNLDAALKNTVNQGLFNVFSFHGLTNDTEQYAKDPGYYIYGTSMDKALEKIKPYVDSGKIWNTHYEDAVIYVREAEEAKVELKRSGDNVILTLTDALDDEIFNAALTLRLKNYGEWEAAKIVQGGQVQYVVPTTDGDVTYLQFELTPDKGEATISPISVEDIPV